MTTIAKRIFCRTLSSACMSVYLMWYLEPPVSLQKVKIPVEECYFYQNCRRVYWNFIKNTPQQVFYTFWNDNNGPDSQNTLFMIYGKLYSSYTRNLYRMLVWWLLNFESLFNSVVPVKIGASKKNLNWILLSNMTITEHALKKTNKCNTSF